MILPCTSLHFPLPLLLLSLLASLTPSFPLAPSAPIVFALALASRARSMPAALIPGGSTAVSFVKLCAGFSCWVFAAVVGHLLGWVSVSSILSQPLPQDGGERARAVRVTHCHAETSRRSGTQTARQRCASLCALVLKRQCGGGHEACSLRPARS